MMMNDAEEEEEEEPCIIVSPASPALIFNMPLSNLPLVVDSRAKALYDRSHISNAISCLDAEEMERELAENEGCWDTFNTICIIVEAAAAADQGRVEALVAALLATPRLVVKKVKRVLVLHDYEAFAASFPFLLSTHPAALDVFYPSLILPWGLYLGNAANSSEEQVLRNLGISLVVNATREGQSGYVPNHFEGQVAYLRLPVVDDESQSMLEHWLVATAAIKQCKDENKKVMVHCHQGKSRSASVIIHYLLTHEEGFSTNVAQALMHVKECRPIAMPNDSFMHQLAMCFEPDV